MQVQIDDQGAVEQLFGPVWEPGPDRAAGRWREAQLVLDAIAREIELLAIELTAGPRVERFDEVHGTQVHHVVVRDLPAGVRATPFSAGPYTRHERATIDGAALDALSATPALEWATVRVLASFAATDDRAWSLAGASDVRPFARGETLGVAGPLDRPGFGLHGPLDVTIDDDLGRTRVTLERAWSSWRTEGPELDRYRRIIASLAALGLRPEPLEPTAQIEPAPTAQIEPLRAAKPEHRFVASRAAGPCAQCRHALAADGERGQIECNVTHQRRQTEALCEARVALPRHAGQPQAQWSTYFFFERYDGHNRVSGEPFNADVRAEDFVEAPPARE